MAKGNKPKGRAAPKPAGKKEKLREEDFDEIDTFHKNKDAIHGLSDDDDNDAGFGEESDEDAVMDLDLEGSDEDEDDEDDDEDFDSDEDIEGGGRLAQLAKHERELRRKLKLQEGEDEEDEEGREEGDERRGWGSNKKKYHGADTVDYELTDDEEAPAEEEAEARRMQKEAAAALRPSDAGLSSDEEGSEDEDEEDEEGEEAMEIAAGRAAAAGGRSKGSAPVVMERGRGALAAISEADRLERIASDAPELMAILDSLRQSLAEVKGRVGPLLRSAESGEYEATSEGISYLEAKHLLLLSYCSHVVFYLLLKAEGRPVKDHPVVSRLVQIRAFLEKTRPIDRKLQYQIDKLLQSAGAGEAAAAEGGDGAAAAAAAGGAGPAAAAKPSGDTLRFRPRPDRLLAREGGGAEEEGGVYRPPRLNPVTMDGEETEKRDAKERRREREMRRRAGRSEVLQEMAAEAAGAPEEYRLAPVGLESASALKERQRAAAREALEEDLMLRVPTSKEERRRLQREQRRGMAGAGLMSDFAEEMADLVEKAEGLDKGGRGGVDPLFLQRSGVSAKYGADLESMKKQHRSGDDDLPKRDSLSERRARMDAKRAREGARREEAAEARAVEREEDEFYKETKETQRAKKQRRLDSSNPTSFPPLAEADAGGKARGITSAIFKNRGLTPHRNKELKNPRKKNRLKYENALVRRKGQVQEARREERGYGGEATGVRAKIVKSTKFK